MAATTTDRPAIDIGRVIRRGFTVVGRNFLPMTALVLVLGAAPQIAIRYQWLIDMRAGLSFFASPYGWTSFAVGMVVGSLVHATLVHVSLRDLRGQAPDIADSLVESLKLILPLIGIGLMTMFIVAIGAVLLIVPGVIAYLALIVAVPVLIQERLGVMASLQRSMDLTRGLRGWIFLLVLLAAAAFTAFSLALGSIAAAIGGAGLWGQAIQDELGGALLSILMAPMLSALYIELRTAKEGPIADEVASVFT
jgi:hypothetical protein